MEALENIDEDVALRVIDDLVLASLSLLFFTFTGELLSDVVDKSLGEHLLGSLVTGGV